MQDKPAPIGKMTVNGKTKIVYVVKTANFLPSAKMAFKDLGNALNFIKKIVDKKEPWVKDYQVMKSFWIYRIDEKEMPEWERIFQVSKKILKVEPPNEKEKGRSIKACEVPQKQL